MWLSLNDLDQVNPQKRSNENSVYTSLLTLGLQFPKLYHFLFIFRVKFLNYFNYYPDVTYQLYSCSLVFLSKWMWKILSCLAVLETHLHSIRHVQHVHNSQHKNESHDSITNEQQGWISLWCIRKTVYLFYCLNVF